MNRLSVIHVNWNRFHCKRLTLICLISIGICIRTNQLQLKRKVLCLGIFVRRRCTVINEILCCDVWNRFLHLCGKKIGSPKHPSPRTYVDHVRRTSFRILVRVPASQSSDIVQGGKKLILFRNCISESVEKFF